ncbi:MAG: hypothetical protein ACREOF_09165 [Gemmatimonadales bacterium]
MSFRGELRAAAWATEAHGLALGLGLLLLYPAPAEAQDTTLAGVVTSYLECIECMNGELQAVTLRGGAAVSLLTRRLRGGPPLPALQSRRQSLFALQARAPRPGHPDSLAAPFRRSLDNYVAQYRTRAAHALRVLGPMVARDSLCAVSWVEFRSDVQVAVRTAQAAVGCP